MPTRNRSFNTPVAVKKRTSASVSAMNARRRRRWPTLHAFSKGVSGQGSSGVRRLSAPAQQRQDRVRNFHSVRFNGEVAAVEQPHFGIRVVTLERVGTGGGEEWILVAPDHQRRWPMAPEILVQLRVLQDVVAVV